MIGEAEFSGDVNHAIDGVIAFARNHGGDAVVTSMQRSSQAQAISISLTLFNPQGEKESNAYLQITTTPETSIQGGTTWKRVYISEGFPSYYQPLLSDLPTIASRWQNPSGVQALVEDRPTQSQGGAAMAQAVREEDTGEDAKSAKLLASTAIALIDVATVRIESEKPNRERSYIGASSIANPCMAFQELNLRGFPSNPPGPQLIRIFNEGHRIEKETVAMLKECGHKVEEIDPSTGEQWEYTALGGHYVCHLDGFITLLGSEERMTLEIKSMNKASFESLVKKTVRHSHRDYYEQMQSQMQLVRMNGLVVDNCLFVAYCKDNSKYHLEVVPYNFSAGEAMLSKAGDVALLNDNKRLGKYEQQYDCKTCFKHTSCWNPYITEKVCRRCVHAIPSVQADGKAWWCKKHGMEAKEPCDDYKLFKPKRAA